MSEDKSTVKNGPEAEMAPQEDGTKVPLTKDSAEQVKFTSTTSPNGDAKVDLGEGQTFTGLTKEELLKFSNDPFWIRLRWFLFILFWFGWLAMLVGSIVIIVYAPRCQPPPELKWPQESPMIDGNPKDFNSDGIIDATDIPYAMTSLGLSSVFFGDIMNPLDFKEYSSAFSNVGHKVPISDGQKMVTNFIPDTLDPRNTWARNDSYRDIFMENSRRLNYSSPLLLEVLKDLVDHWMDRDVNGFLIEKADTPEKVEVMNELNKHAEEYKNGAVVDGIVDVEPYMGTIAEPSKLQSFLEESIKTWPYFKIKPSYTGADVTKDQMQLMLISLYMVPGTPILDLQPESFNQSKQHLEKLLPYRNKPAVKFGTTNFANTTSVVAFTRVQKGTPAYAVLVNLHDVNETVDFSTTPNIADRGTLEYRYFSGNDSAVAGKVNMGAVLLRPYEGLILQFVPKF